MKLSMQNKTSHHLEDNDEFYFDNDILNDKVHLFFKSNRNSVDEYSIRGHQFLNSFELSINTLGIEHDTMLKKLGNIIFARIKQLEKDYEMIRDYEDSQKKPKMATPEQNAEFNRQLKDALVNQAREEA
tara:strand:- start:42 stop:428 length:387 start_codon:yes stop_codon:yes gene_type:complete